MSRGNGEQTHEFRRNSTYTSFDNLGQNGASVVSRKVVVLYSEKSRRSGLFGKRSGNAAGELFGNSRK